MNTIDLRQGDCLEVMRDIPDGSIDAIITDPPYGYSFMGKDWDKAVTSVEIWKECLRVLKPGAFACVMSAPRSDVQNAMISRLMEAGFRLDFTPIYWTYASGFPKAGNVGKLVDKRLGAEREVTGVKIAPNGTEYPRGYEIRDTPTPFSRSNGLQTAPATDQAKALDGSYTGFQPKPAVEVIIVAMKPLSEKTYVDQALKNGKGITWLDDCRIPATSEDMGDWDRFKGHQSPDSIRKNLEDNVKPNFAERVDNGVNNQGRFPANLLVSDDVLNDGVVRKAGKNKEEKGTGGIWNKGTNLPIGPEYGDSGSYSRYFDLDKWAAAHLTEQQMKTFPFAIFPKASKSEKNKGLEHLEPKIRNDGRAEHLASGDMPHNRSNNPKKNHHPTVKPLKLMSYLITLFSREGDTVLDPFMGSGTTGVACKNTGRNFIGIELDEEYFEIAEKRIEESKQSNNYNPANKGELQ